MKENIIQFPDSQDCFTWRSNKGELLKLYKGIYAIIKDPGGQYREEYITPGLKFEDIVLGFGEFESDVHGQSQVIEKRQINSRKEYEALLQNIEELNKPQKNS